MEQAIELSVSIGSKCCFGRRKGFADASPLPRQYRARRESDERLNGKAAGRAAVAFADALKARRQGHRHYISIVRRAALMRTGSCGFKGMLLAPKISVRMLWAFDAGRDTTLARQLARIAAGTETIAFLILGRIGRRLQLLTEKIDIIDLLIVSTHSVQASGRRKLIGFGKILFRLPQRYPVVNTIEHVIRHDGIALEDVTLPDGPSALNFVVPTLPEPKRALWSAR